MHEVVRLEEAVQRFSSPQKVDEETLVQLRLLLVKRLNAMGGHLDLHPSPERWLAARALDKDTIFDFRDK